MQTLLFGNISYGQTFLERIILNFFSENLKKSPILFLSYCFKNFLSNKKINMHPGANVMKLFTVVDVRNKLECLSLEGLSSPVLWAMHVYISRCWIALPGTNTLAYCEHSRITNLKSFIIQGPGSYSSQLGRKWLAVTSTLIYYGTELMKAVNLYCTAPRGLYYKTFYGSNCCCIVIS